MCRQLSDFYCKIVRRLSKIGFLFWTYLWKFSYLSVDCWWCILDKCFFFFDKKHKIEDHWCPKVQSINWFGLTYQATGHFVLNGIFWQLLYKSFLIIWLILPVSFIFLSHFGSPFLICQNEKCVLTIFCRMAICSRLPMFWIYMVWVLLI